MEFFLNSPHPEILLIQVYKEKHELQIIIEKNALLQKETNSK